MRKMLLHFLRLELPKKKKSYKIQKKNQSRKRTCSSAWISTSLSCWLVSKRERAYIKQAGNWELPAYISIPSPECRGQQACWQEQINIRQFCSETVRGVMGKFVCIGSETVFWSGDGEYRGYRICSEMSFAACLFISNVIRLAHIYVNFHFHLDKYNRNFD